MRSRTLTWIIFITTLAGCALFLALAATTASAQNQSKSKLAFYRTTRLNGANARHSTPGGVVGHMPDVDVNFPKPQLSGTVKNARVPSDHVPRPVGNAVTTTGSFFGFPGLTELDQALAPTGVSDGFNFSLDPPDQGLAVGNGFVVEAVNSAIAVFDTSGNPLSFEALSLFLNLPPNVTITPAGQVIFGTFLVDPRVYFDGDTGRFFLTVVSIGLDPNAGNFTSPSIEFIAVSQTSDPTGIWNIFQIDVTNDGDAIFGTCPCFGDQPLMGADKFGFYISTNAFTISTEQFRGAQIYAISKQALVNNTPAAVVRFHNLTQAEGPGSSIQPAQVPPKGSFELGNGGTEYFVSSLDFSGTLDDRLTIWALTNTNSLDTTPRLSLSNRVITTQVYGVPPDTQQKPGPTPLRDILATNSSLVGLVGVFKNHIELVSTGDDRMQQVTFADGKLWTSVGSVVKLRGLVRCGGAFFILAPSVSGTTVSATVVNQGYVAINSPHQNSVLYPSIGVNASGKAVIAFSVVGQDFFPSAGFAPLDAVNGAGAVVISAPGALPDDSFTGYVPFGFRSARWGDYSRAVADESGAIWLGNEFIPSGPRDIFANWGTFITMVNP